MSKKSLLDSIEIASPCSKDWNEMIGDSTQRFCQSCNKDVYNLSAMSRKKAIKLTAQSGKKVCVRYVRGADGSVQTADQKLYKIAGRASRLAAGVFGASLALSTATYAQGEAILIKKDAASQTQNQSRKTKSDNSTSQISFTIGIYDQIVTGIQVQLINQKSKETFSAISNQQGIAQFNLLPKGRYRINIEAQEGFGKFDSYFIELREAIEPNIKISLVVAHSIVVGDFSFTWYEIPLLHAVAQEDVSEVKRLLSAGANVNVKDKGDSELTALHVAVEVGNVELVQTLLDAGAKVNAKNKSKYTPLSMIGDLLDEDEKEKSAAQIIRLLIAKGANVNVRDDEGKTVLMMACFNENLEAVKFLLESGANPNLKDEDGETALQKTDSEEIKLLLKQYGARE